MKSFSLLIHLYSQIHILGIISYSFLFLSGFSFINSYEQQDSRRRETPFFNSSVRLPPASETLGYQPGDYCRGLTPAYGQQLEQNWELGISEHKLLITKLRVLVAFLYRLVKISLCKNNIQTSMKVSKTHFNTGNTR